MARPVEFDENKLLTNAMEQCWKEGYEARSGQKLLDCTGRKSGTLCPSCGDNETCVTSCVDQYNRLSAKQIEATLGNAKLKPWDAIIAYLNATVVEVSNKHRGLGCLLVNSLCESINYDKEMKKVVRSSQATVRKALLARVKEAHKAGKIKKGFNAEFATDVILNTLYGARVNSRDGKNAKQLKELLDFSVASLKK
jgi:TetR/AcrR family transcriptional repressor of nem operon